MAENRGSAVPGTGVEALTVFARRTIPDSANAYYRLHVPSIGLNDDGRFRAIVEDHSRGMDEAEKMQWFSVAARSDFNLYYGQPTEAMWRRVTALLGLEPAPSGPFKRMKNPPTLVWSLDDNFHAVAPTNDSFLYHGTRLPDGTELEDGDDVEIEGPDGQRHILWKSGKVYKGQPFSIAKNKARLREMDNLLSRLGGVTTTTERLASFYRELGYPNVHVFPNSVLFEDYAMFSDHKVVRKDPTQTKVMWQGGSSHMGDWASVREAIPKTCANHPKLKWMLWGSDYPWIWKDIPNDQFEHLPWVDYSVYKTMLAMLDFDFVVAPLVPNLFNDGKSSIKMYEAAALPVPKPCLASNTPPYSDSIIDGETGFLFNDEKEFLEKFGILVENPDLRKEMGENAKQWVRENRSTDVTVPPLGDWMIETRDKFGVAETEELKDLVQTIMAPEEKAM